MTSDSSDTEPSNKNEPKGFLKQTDEWFGRRHRIHFFVSGFVTAAAVLWLFYEGIINPTVDSIHRQAIESHEKTIEQLKEELDVNRRASGAIVTDNAERVNILVLQQQTLTTQLVDSSRKIAALQDSIALMKSFGQYLGFHTIPTAPNSWDSAEMYPLYGRRLRAFVESWSLDREGVIAIKFMVDTCEERNDWDTLLTCAPFMTSLPTTPGSYFTIHAGGHIYTIFCRGKVARGVNVDIWVRQRIVEG